MSNLLINALRRKLTVAEALGDDAKAEALRARIAEGDAEPTEAPDEESVEGGSLDEVEFASPAARAAAEGMDPEAFKRRKKSSEYGFTKADVERIAAATDDGDDNNGEDD